MSRSILIASGKGGVGKSALTANLGVVLARRGFSVVIVDTDIGLRSQDAFLGLENAVVYDLVDVSKKECPLDKALLSCPSVSLLKLLPASQFSRARSLDSGRFAKILKTLKEENDFVLIDAPAGIEKGFRNSLNAGVDQVILISTPDEICIRDVERAAQIIISKQQPRPQLVVNRLDNDLIRRHEMFSARIVADTVDLSLLGEIPEDSAVYRSVLRHDFFVDYDCPARKAVLRIAGRLLDESIPLPEIGKNKISFKDKIFRKKIKEVTPLDRH